MKTEVALVPMSYQSVSRILYTMRTAILTVLIAAFLFTIVHSFIHDSLEHHHDSDCSVYVLEQLYFSGDILSDTSLYLLFTAFVFISFITSIFGFKRYQYFSIRAPPQL
ncbi:MAG: hypothetical protein U9N52_03165 [Campylobacterota bacterium]|nr:hypothetical protein [Campylobacterota bacterium]